MSSAKATEQDTPLSSALEAISRIDREIDSAEMAVKELKKRRDKLASIAVEEMTAGRLDGVRVAGRSWRIEWVHSVTATAEKQDAILAAARAAGMEAQLVGVNTTRLKSLLKEMSQAAGRDARQPWAEGTPFAGIVSEYVRPELRHLTIPGATTNEAAPF
jgi:hypothetical protein